MQDQLAILTQSAVDLDAVGAEIDSILTQIREGEAAINRATRIVDDWRVKAGQWFAEARKKIPTSGPKAARWSEFVEARGVSRDTAANYMKLAEYAATHPDAVTSGKSVIDVYKELGIKKDSPNRFGESLPTANYILDVSQRLAGPVMTTALWETYLRGKMTEEVADARLAAIKAMFPGDNEAARRLLREEQDLVDDWREEAQKAKRAKQSEPPLPPAPAHYLPRPMPFQAVRRRGRMQRNKFTTSRLRAVFLRLAILPGSLHQPLRSDSWTTTTRPTCKTTILAQESQTPPRTTATLTTKATGSRKTAKHRARTTIAKRSISMGRNTASRRR
jgi:phage shock protein A